MDLSNLLEVFLALCQANSGWSLTNKLKLVDWLKALKQVKGFNAMSSLCLWQRFISQRTVQVFTNEMPFESLSTSAIRSLQTFCCPGLSQMRGNKTKRQKQNPIREDLNWKKNVFFRALPELPNPPPHDPNSGNLVLFFRKSKFKICKSV